MSTEVAGLIEEFRKARHPQAIRPSASVAVSWANTIADAYESLFEQYQAARVALEEIARIKPDTRPIQPSDNYARARKAVQIARRALEPTSATVCKCGYPKGMPNTERVPRLYVDGRPLLRCLDCDASFVDEGTEPSHKGLARLSRKEEAT